MKISLHGHLSSYENSSLRERCLSVWILRKKYSSIQNPGNERWAFCPSSNAEWPGLSLCRWASMHREGWLRLDTEVPPCSELVPLTCHVVPHFSPSFLFYTDPINVLQTSHNVSRWVLTPKINSSHIALYFPPVTSKVIAKVSSCACPLGFICLLVFTPRGFSFFRDQLCFWRNVCYIFLFGRGKF